VVVFSQSGEQACLRAGQNFVIGKFWVSLNEHRLTAIYASGQTHLEEQEIYWYGKNIGN